MISHIKPLLTECMALNLWWDQSREFLTRRRHSIKHESILCCAPTGRPMSPYYLLVTTGCSFICISVRDVT